MTGDETAGVAIEPGLERIVRLGVLWCAVAPAPGADRALDAPLAEAVGAARGGDVADTSAARALYRAIGVDPTKTRPSSEALLRRVRRGGPFPRINALADIANWCSLQTQLPYGLYDAAAIRPPLVLRRGGPGDAYAGIRKDAVRLDGRLALFDALGPFGNPTSDSARTMTRAATRDVLVAVFAPAAVPRERMARVLDMTSARLAEYAGGAETGRWVS
ncbi:MAG TPA: phenylalanine--tRNA ligase beta subunit-related protein [Vicinamibacterales bacterium]|nr:phenylalanine--tRNA ligase beta subunit-related protein [Vicinamibacterales bacterium]HOQ59870.1 phenylalanine--tRNA ligase beta subunit-related protein [Vicinamibacterales bacterium]HPK70633.1 phenylalanine--tRNA ligase beta subunit-related protein [Vicinamibacterales bacterium]